MTRAHVPTREEAAEIEAGLAEIDRGESVTVDEFMRELRAVRAEETAEVNAALAEAALGGGIPADEVLRELRAPRLMGTPASSPAERAASRRRPP